MDSKKPVAYAGIDIGGTLAKFCLFIPKSANVEIEQNEDLSINLKKGKIIFSRREVGQIDEFIAVVKKYQQLCNVERFRITGGGSFKLFDLLKKELQVELIRTDEMETIYKGLQFLVSYVDDYAFYFTKASGRVFLKAKEKYPFLLVNVGSGVSILKFEGDGNFERITGTCLGGGTFMGLSKLILGESDFETLLKLAVEGKSENVDLLIRDIFPIADSPSGELEKEPIAVSLGKVPKLGKVVHDMVEKNEHVERADIAKSLLKMIAFNIAQIAFFAAKLHNVKSIYFAGNFIREQPVTMEVISFGLGYFSKNDEEANINSIFLKHDGYIGALGCLLAEVEEHHYDIIDP